VAAQYLAVYERAMIRAAGRRSGPS
jgi:hypothetical protein